MDDPLEDTVDMQVTEYFSRTLFQHKSDPCQPSFCAATDVG
jgi:hypothetical protein